MDNILTLNRDLVARTYRHSAYQAFKISDPKPRDIHKASVRDRLLHHAMYRQLYSFFERTFISDSYSCRNNKGMHRAMDRFREYAYRESTNHTRTLWVLKCNVRKFFASIDHAVLMDILRTYIPDKDTLLLIDRIVDSFYSTAPGKGLPLGNLTSQLLVNVYMNEFDQFAKHRLKARYYIRYADDFVILSRNRNELAELIPRITQFLQDRLKLELHPRKVSIGTLAASVDFLGWVHFPDHRVLRTATRRRMFRRIQKGDGKEETISSYLGMLSHGNAHTLTESLLSQIHEK